MVPALLGRKTFAEHLTRILWLPSWYIYCADVSSIENNSVTHSQYILAGIIKYEIFSVAHPRILIMASLDRSHALCFHTVCVILLAHIDDKGSVHSLSIGFFFSLKLGSHGSRASEVTVGAEFREKKNPIDKLSQNPHHLCVSTFSTLFLVRGFWNPLAAKG